MLGNNFKLFFNLLILNWYLELFAVLFIKCVFCTSIATGSGHPDYPGQPDHILPGSTGSDPLYKISKSDPDSA